MAEGGQDYRVSLTTPPTNDDYDRDVLDDEDDLRTNNSQESSPPSSSSSPTFHYWEERFGSQVMGLIFILEKNVVKNSIEADVMAQRKSITKRAFCISMINVGRVDALLAKIVKFHTDFLPPEIMDQSVVIWQEIYELLKTLVRCYDNWNWILKMAHLRKLLRLVDFQTQRTFAVYIVGEIIELKYSFAQEHTVVFLELLAPLFQDNPLLPGQPSPRPAELAEDMNLLSGFINLLFSTDPLLQASLLVTARRKFHLAGSNVRISYALQTLVIFAYELAYKYGQQPAQVARCEVMFAFCEDTIDLLDEAGMKQVSASLLLIGAQVITRIDRYTGREITAHGLISKALSLHELEGSGSDNSARLAVCMIIYRTFKINGFPDTLKDMCLSAVASPWDKAARAKGFLDTLKDGVKIAGQAQTESMDSRVQVQLNMSLLHHDMYFLEMGCETSVELMNGVIDNLRKKIPKLDSSEEMRQRLDNAEMRMQENPNFYQGVSHGSTRP